MAGPFSRDPRRRELRRLRHRDVVTTREGWVVDLAGAVRVEAIRALASDTSEEVERALVSALADPLDEVRAAAVAALEAQGSVAGASQCAAAAPGWDPRRFPVSRERAWHYVATCGGPEDVVPLVAGLLASDASAHIDPPALRAIDRALGADEEQAAEALTRAVRCLDHGDAGVVSRAVELAVHLGPREPQTVVRALRDDARAPVAAAVLGEIGDLSHTPELAELLDESRPTPVRAAAATALGKVGGHRAARLLSGLADDPDPTVRRAATVALAPLAGLLTAPRFEAVESPADVESWAGEHEAPMSDLAEAPAEEPEAIVATPADEPADVVDLAEPDELEDDEPEPDEPDAEDDDSPAAPRLVSRAPGIVPRPTVFPAPRATRARAALATMQASAYAPAQAQEDEAPELAALAEPEALVEPEPVPEPEAPVEPEPESLVESPAPADALEPAEVTDGEIIEDDPDAPWNRPHPPAVAEPPPRPRGARRPIKRR
ncbi:MAG: HEAT repeat domain-containing protein [Baekduiaceae bacterium]